MTSSVDRLARFLDGAPLAALVEVCEALGSTPREQGAWMLVSPGATLGTIGGGQLEFIAIDRARALLDPAPGQAAGPPAREQATLRLSIPLGPEIGQCCGGRVGLSIRTLDQTARHDLLDRARAEDAERPRVLILGGGHVGHALAGALALLPLAVTVVETRPEALEGLADGVDRLLTPVPEEAVRNAPAGSAYVVLTHDHALDFLIVAEALARRDAAYVGMIGSMTKRATFRAWFLKQAGGDDEAAARLVCPIGGGRSGDKRPAVIAALVAAEIAEALFTEKIPGAGGDKIAECGGT